MLTCNHTPKFSRPVPKIGDQLFCVLCDRYVSVMGHVDEWVLKCTECNYTRRYGQAQLTAETMAAKHGATKNHTVALWHGEKVDHLVHEHATPMIAPFHDMPPF